jgi:putative methyltransferase (TIGR04325 family)
LLQRFVSNRDQNLFWGVYETWAEAEAAASAYGRSGYDNSESADLYNYRIRMDPHDYPSLYWLTRSLEEGMQGVFDVGGAIGIKLMAFREPLSRFTNLQWLVQDVPAMVAKGRELSLQRGDADKLRFTEQFADGDGSDVLFASGVLQYLPSTLAENLARWKRPPRRIIINTAPIHPEHAFFTVNSIGTAFCPYRVQTQAELVRGLSELGYRLRETWRNPDKPMAIPLHPERSLRHYTGFCLDLKSQSF